MDLVRLQKDLVDQIYIDVEITFVDENESITGKFHKIILVSGSEYFHKLFTFGEGMDKKQFEIKISDANVAHNIVLSFYGKQIEQTNDPEWLNVLKEHEVKFYLMMSNDITRLYNLNLPRKGFDKLLEMVEIFDLSDDKLVTMIKKNFPLDYPIENLSSDFVNVVYDVVDYSMLAFIKNELYAVDMDGQVTLNNSPCFKDFNANKVRFANFTTTETDGIYQSTLLLIFNDSNVELYDMNKYELTRQFSVTDSEDYFFLHMASFSDDNKFFATHHGRDKITICDATMGRVIKQHSFGYNIKCISISNDAKEFAYGNSNDIHICDALSGKEKKCLRPNSSNIQQLVYTKSNTRLVCLNDHGEVSVWDTRTYECVQLMYCLPRTGFIKISPDGKWIVAVCQSSIKEDNGFEIRNAETSARVCNTRGLNYPINSVTFSADGKFVSYVEGAHISITKLDSGREIKFFSPHLPYIVYLFFYPNYNDKLNKKLSERLKTIGFDQDL